MPTQVCWIDGPWPGRLAVAPRPRGGDWLEDEMKGLSNAGADAVVSLLEPDEAAELGLEHEQQSCESQRVAFYSLAIEDRGIPASMPAALEFLRGIETLLDDGKNVVVHCRQGIGRSGLTAAALLILAGQSADRAVEVVTAARGVSVPETKEQRRWLDAFAQFVLNSF